MKRARISKLIMISLLSAFFFYWCERSEAASDESKVVLKINTYEMTAEEFKDEARLMMPNKTFPAGFDSAKGDLVDEIITKQVLLQEAQREDFDKDSAFRREIERYWEQALLKLLIRAKMVELSRQVSVSEDEVKSEYERLAKDRVGTIKPFEKMAPEIKNEIRQGKMQAALDKWVRTLRDRSDIRIYKEKIGQIEIKGGGRHGKVQK